MASRRFNVRLLASLRGLSPDDLREGQPQLDSLEVDLPYIHPTNLAVESRGVAELSVTGREERYDEHYGSDGLAVWGRTDLDLPEVPNIHPRRYFWLWFAKKSDGTFNRLGWLFLTVWRKNGEEESEITDFDPSKGIEW